MALRLAFLGTSPFAVPTLRALAAAGYDIAAVYTQPPRPAGRGHRDQPSPVHQVADELGIPVRTPPSLRREEPQADFRALDLDAAVVAAYGLILPAPILDAPRLGCFNVHGSLLPRWRGAAPIERAILAGDDESGVTIMRMDEGLDTGPTLLTERVPITDTTTAADLHRTLGDIGAQMMCRALPAVADGSLTALPQPPDGATYAHKLDRDEGALDWQRPAAELDRVVRALNPSPGVWFSHAGERLRVLAARPEAGTGAPGVTVDDRLGVACGSGVLRLLRLQRPGRSAMDADAFLRGYRLPAGTSLA